ncbi:MAG: ATPase [Bacteroidales bacterium]
MILIADSGSTKTEWCLCGRHETSVKVYTKGINPFYQSEKEISESIGTELMSQLGNEDISHIYFYGAGCAFPDKNKQIEAALKTWFPNAVCEVKSDLYGACRGLLGNSPGIACILGTGSNSCYYDGKEIISNISPLGFILGDEGSGAHLGKKMVAEFLKNQLPEDLKSKFLEEFQTSPGDILDHVYRQPFPNRYLAGLSRFLINHIDEPECYDLVHGCFREFFERNVMQYDFSDELPVNFVGSIAYHYREILERVASEFGLWIEKVDKNPIDGLVKYHTND